MDLQKLSLTELKALAFDEIAKLEQAQNNIRILNDEINKRNQPEVAEDIGEPVKEKK